MRPLDVEGRLDVPVRVHRRSSTVGIDDLEIGLRQPELAREYTQVARRRGIVIGIDDGDSTGTARGVGARGVGIASRDR
jgi:hypothetical protein